MAITVKQPAIIITMPPPSNPSFVLHESLTVSVALHLSKSVFLLLTMTAPPAIKPIPTQNTDITIASKIFVSILSIVFIY